MTLQAALFDLDNTLYPASSGLMVQIDRRIGEFVQTHLSLDEPAAFSLRKHYYQTYGTTLRGLQLHHEHIPADLYLEFVHSIAVDEYLRPDEALSAQLAALPLRKIIFTNSPREHAERVLDCLGIAQHFEAIFDLRYFAFVAKPGQAAYQLVLDELGLDGAAAVMLEDSLANLPPAKALGMTTVLVDESQTVQTGADLIVPTIYAALSAVQALLDPALAGSAARRGHHAAPEPATAIPARRSPA